MAKPLMIIRVVKTDLETAKAAKVEIEKLGQFDVVILPYSVNSSIPPHVTVHRADGLGG